MYLVATALDSTVLDIQLSKYKIYIHIYIYYIYIYYHTHTYTLGVRLVTV